MPSGQIPNPFTISLRDVKALDVGGLAILRLDIPSGLWVSDMISIMTNAATAGQANPVQITGYVWRNAAAYDMVNMPRVAGDLNQASWSTHQPMLLRGGDYIEVIAQQGTAGDFVGLKAMLHEYKGA